MALRYWNIIPVLISIIAFTGISTGHEWEFTLYLAF